MKMIEARQAARNAVAAHEMRPATAVIHDSEDARLIVFRLAAGQEVAPHTSTSTVVLTVLEGTGTLSGVDTERVCSDGAIVTYAPGELHGMRATSGELLLLATITPRPGSR